MKKNILLGLLLLSFAPAFSADGGEMGVPAREQGSFLAFLGDRQGTGAIRTALAQVTRANAMIDQAEDLRQRALRGVYYCGAIGGWTITGAGIGGLWALWSGTDRPERTIAIPTVLGTAYGFRRANRESAEIAQQIVAARKADLARQAADEALLETTGALRDSRRAVREATTRYNDLDLARQREVAAAKQATEEMRARASRAEAERQVAEAGRAEQLRINGTFREQLSELGSASMLTQVWNTHDRARQESLALRVAIGDRVDDEVTRTRAMLAQRQQLLLELGRDLVRRQAIKDDERRILGDFALQLEGEAAPE